MINERHLTMAELKAGLEHIRRSLEDAGVLQLIVRRPQTEARDVLQEAELNLSEGLAGDNWRERGSSRTPDGSAHPDMQLTVMNARVIALLALQPERWSLAGDQLYIDLDLSVTNAPPGTRLAIGSAVIEFTPQPHMGCKKFAARFGLEALEFISSPVGKQLQMRGLNAKVVQSGVIRVGDVARKL